MPGYLHNLFVFRAGLILFGLSFCGGGAFSQQSAYETSGDVLQYALPTAALASTFIWRDDKKPWLQFVKTMGVSVVVTHGLKRLINKPRPSGGNYAFPSGHTSAAFTGAAFLQKRFGWKVGAPVYLLAAYTGWTRVEANKHDYWDVLGGAVVGIGSAYLFAKRYRKPGFNVSFGKGRVGYTLYLQLRF